MVSTSTPKKLSQDELLQIRTLNEKTLADYYIKKLKYMDQYHNVKNITQ